MSNGGGPPRTRALIVGLVVTLLLVAFGFWRATAGTGSTPAATENAGAAATATRADASNGSTSAPPAAPAPAPAAPAPQAAAPPPAPAANVQKTAPAGPLDEGHLMARLRAIKDKEPAAAVELAREGNRRFTDSANAPERTSILIHALVAVDKGSEARGEAEQMVNHYPDSTWVRDVEMFTGAHRHRNVRTGDAGQLIFE